MRTSSLLSLVGSLLIVSPLACQASFTTAGTGCTINNQTLAIGHQGLPRLGQSFQITYSGPNYTYNSAQQIAQPHLALGFQPLITPIPANLLIYQPMGCTGYLQPDAVIASAPDPVQPMYAASLTMSIPNDPGLINVQFLAQWLTVHQQCGFAGCGLSAATTSDVGFAIIGP